MKKRQCHDSRITKAKQNNHRNQAGGGEEESAKPSVTTHDVRFSRASRVDKKAGWSHGRARRAAAMAQLGKELWSDDGNNVNHCLVERIRGCPVPALFLCLVSGGQSRSKTQVKHEVKLRIKVLEPRVRAWSSRD